MSKITIANMPEVQRTEKAGMLDPSSATAPYRALQGVAQGISDVSEFGLKKLKLNENSAMADQDLFQMSIEDEINNDMQTSEMRNNHEAWEGYIKEKTSARGKQLAEDIKGLDIRPAVKEQMLQAHEKWSQGLVGEWKEKATARDYELKSISIKLQAQSYYNNGLFDEGDEILKRIGLPETEYEILRKELRNEGVWQNAEMDLAGRNSPQEILEYFNALDQKEEGEITNIKTGESETVQVYSSHKGLNDKQRGQLKTRAVQKYRKANLALGRSLENAMKLAEEGKYTMADERELIMLGATEAELDRVSRASTATTLVEEDMVAVGNLREEIKGGWFTHSQPNMFQRNLNRDEAEYMKYVRKIDKIKANPATKRSLMSELIEVWKSDIQDGVLNLTTGKEELSGEELGMWKKLQEGYSIANAHEVIGTNTLGGFMKQHIMDFTEWYRATENPTQEQIDEKYKSYMQDIYGQKASVKVMEAIDSMMGGDMYAMPTTQASKPKMKKSPERNR